MVHNPTLRDLIAERYSAERLDSIATLLHDRGVFEFPAMANGLFAAVGQAQADGATAPYRYVWVRDNVYIAYAHYLNGATNAAAANVRGLAAYFLKHQSRFVDIIQRNASPVDPMNRPHVRFDGATLEEVPQKWAHAQNDALGYFLWLFCKLVNDRLMPFDRDGLRLLQLFVEYFSAIEFWRDEDSGHWEEERKINASSIGVVVAALGEVARLHGLDGATLRRTASGLIDRGHAALAAILPAECVQPDPRKFRPADAASLFLVYPLSIVDRPMADRIVANVVRSLRREIGVCRYLRDSYWAPNYKDHFATPTERTKDFSDDMSARDALVKEGEEALWCVFDSVLSAIFARRYAERRETDDRALQDFYFSRCLGQITADFKCPEAYYLERSHWVPNDHAPLLWAQANLWTAVKELKSSLTP